ncbi:MAG TPA: hypothetical protein VEH78_00725 [Pseudolabrys sp.]|nr:hypothetical protein [Pseudolabrys sp.]
MPKREAARRSISQIEAALCFVHRTNITRYKKLLATDLADSERLVVQRQLAEEEAALRKFGNADFT